MNQLGITSEPFEELPDLSILHICDDYSLAFDMPSNPLLHHLHSLNIFLYLGFFKYHKYHGRGMGFKETVKAIGNVR